MKQAMIATNDNGVLQKPIGSGFDATSTTQDVIKGIDLSGKIAIVTGGYAGIGLETVKTFVNAGATVIVPARNTEKARKNLEGIRNVEVEPMDLMDSESIGVFTAKFITSGRPLHLLINNAGIMWNPLTRDTRGYESQFSTNHLGHFQLTAQLWEALKKADGARVINVSSWGHHFASIDFDDPNFEHKEYETLLGYGQSKTANILFSLELDKRGTQYGIRSYSLHPGAIVETDLKRYLTDDDLKKLGVYDAQGNVIHDPANGRKSIPQGASTTVWCAVSPQLNNIGGVYCENTDVAELDLTNSNARDRVYGITKIFGVMPYAVDPENAARLWTLSEKLTGITFSL
ncbi:SDR family NAD(P)-dependent oxidoreductase [Cytophagaceae bacterium YF14B1]|uniref:SDR family NAD(P)-dependent oxidoreductase n=1 Tax=Xanthocytophaga flava TaxID=3048013 RepID=A0AAE3QIC6_9BACT|nr:SDR family NAD(P)-dependent oxidoreductase [Xanthocytophaga flavus]MDJ1479892.1 SDR family NAD(P)-dependent oxidoreductase [Xanthocytophaga flavus]